MLPIWAVKPIVGNRSLVVKVDPTQISGKLVDTWRSHIWKSLQAKPFLPRMAKVQINKLVRGTRPFALSGEGFELRDLSDGQTHQVMQDIWRNRHDAEKSETFNRIAEHLRERGVHRQKKYVIHDQAQIKDLINTCFLDLLTSMEKEGYVATRVSDYGTGGLAKALIWRDGSLWHENGATHRLAAARIVGLKEGFPVEVVGAHLDWLQEHGIYRVADLKKLPSAIQNLACSDFGRGGDAK